MPRRHSNTKYTYTTNRATKYVKENGYNEKDK